MYTIYEDDYAQTAFPRNESDGAVELYWDHPNYLNQWSGRYCTEFPYENWSEIMPLSENHKFGVWCTESIILGHFNIIYKSGIPTTALYVLSPEKIKVLREQIEKKGNDGSLRTIFIPHDSGIPTPVKILVHRENVSSTQAPRLLKVFLCHSSEDKSSVRELYHRLIADNIDPWLDEEKLLPGQDWELEIRKAVRSSDSIIVCLSQNSVTKAGYVQKEIKLALDVADEQPEGKIFLIPLKLEECNAPLRLISRQWVNLFEAKGHTKLITALNHRAKDLDLCVT